MSGTELLKYADKFNVSITREESEQIAHFLRGKNFDLFNDQDRTKVLTEIAKITGPEKAREINKIFLHFTS